MQLSDLLDALNAGQTTTGELNGGYQEPERVREPSPTTQSLTEAHPID